MMDNFNRIKANMWKMISARKYDDVPLPPKKNGGIVYVHYFGK
jgi:hypothetical protein